MIKGGNGSGITGDQIQEGTITVDNLSPDIFEDVLIPANNLDDVQSTTIANNNLFVDSFTVPIPVSNVFNLDSSYFGSFVNLSNAGTPYTVNLPSPGTAGVITLYSEDSVNGTLAAVGGLIDGQATITLAGAASVTLYCDGGSYHTLSFGPYSIGTGTANSLAGYNNAGIFSGVTVSTGLSLSGGTLTATGSSSIPQNTLGLSAYPSSNQLLTSGVGVLIHNNATLWTDGNYNTSTYRYHAPTAGRYRVTLNATLRTDAIGSDILFIIDIVKSTSTFSRAEVQLPGAYTGTVPNLYLSASKEIEMDGISDYIEVYVHQTNGASVDLDLLGEIGGDYNTSLDISYIGSTI